MLDKLTAAVKQLLTDNRDFSTRLERLEKVKPAVVNGRDGKDGKDGVSPDIETIVAAVVNELPEPEKIDTKAIVNDVLAQIPKPRDGRDAPAVNVSDVAAIVLAKIPTPKDGKDGHNGPDLETVVKRVKAQVKDGKPGERGPKGDKGEPGKDGVSVTDVQLKNNELFVWLDGVKRAVGKIKIPAVSAPFNPGNAGGGRAIEGTPADNCRIGFVDYNDAGTTTTPISIPAATETKLTNDTLGDFTLRDFLPKGISDIWNPATNQFDFTQLKLGDMVDIRVDAILTTTQPNQNFRLALALGVGTPSEYEIPFSGGIVKNAGPVEASRFNGIYIGNELTLNNPGEFRIYSDDPATIVIRGWYCKILVRG